MTIAKNALCPCGSGKKYKRCCMGKTEKVYLGNAKGKKRVQPNIFFKNYKSSDLLQIFAGLSLLPENHGKYVRLEELSLKTLENNSKSNEYVSSTDLMAFLDKNYSANPLEDPPVNLFTDLITFYGGDYLIFPGITETGSFILTNLLSAIFNWPDSDIPKQFVSNCTHAVSFVLAVSNEMAIRLGYSRYNEGESDKRNLFVPSDDKLIQLKRAVTFTQKEIQQILQEKQIAKEAVSEFIFDSISLDIKEQSHGESPLVFKPIICSDEEYIIASPATLSYALTEYIWKEAETLGCMSQVNTAYQNVIWNNLKMQLGSMGFSPLELEGISSDGKLPIKDGVYRFDDDKIAYVQFVYDSGSSGHIFEADETIEKCKEKAISKILRIPEYLNFEIFDITILSSIGRDFFHLIERGENTRSITISAFEFDVLWNLKNTTAIDLWKFAIAEQEQLPDSPIMGFSFLDYYKLFKDNEDSFYLSDETKFTLVHVLPGYSSELIRDSKIKSDKHSVLKYHNRRLANVIVQKKDEYAPVYVDIMGISRSELEFLVEGFHQAVWVKPVQISNDASSGLRNLYWEMNDAIAYWLWQIRDDIKEDLKQLGANPLAVEFDLSPKEKFENIERDFVRDENLADKFETISTQSTITIIIPSEINPYLYGPDNEGERVLVRQLLNGINDLLAANYQPQISEERLVQIVEKNAPLGNKKKVFIIDTNNNLLIDPRNLKKPRYAQEYDVSLVLNSIVPTLGSLCPPVGELNTKEEKNDLAFKIVQNALLPKLREKISQYNSTLLLERLIGLNESLIRKREELRVLTPTRIACFVSTEQHQIDLKENLGELNRTTIAVRCLIEHIAAEPSMGNKIISTTGIDELIAIMDQSINWGSLSDQIHFDLFDIKMGVLPSGRIGTEKAQIREVFDPYYDSKTKENIINALDAFHQIFPQQEDLQGKEVPKNLDKAFVSDYGISFTRICEFIAGLAHIGFLQKTSFAKFPLNKLNAEINKFTKHFDDVEFKNAILFLGLVNRGNVESLPEGYEFIDIMPWRFNRMLSLLRKPLVIVDNDNNIICKHSGIFKKLNITKNRIIDLINKTFAFISLKWVITVDDSLTNDTGKLVYWGPRQVLASRLYLAEQCQSDRLRTFEGSEVKNVLGGFAQQRGDELVNTVVKSIKNTTLLIDTDVYIGPKNQLKDNADLGDIDVLVIDSSNKILFSLECKNMSPSRNIKEMVEEVEKLFGRKGKPGWIDKHLRRHNWIESHRGQISSKYGVDISDFQVKSFFVTEVDMLTPYLKKHSLPIPFVSSYEIEEEGYNLLMRR